MLLRNYAVVNVAHEKKRGANEKESRAIINARDE
jgi:hypothetical protein